MFFIKIQINKKINKGKSKNFCVTSRKVPSTNVKKAKLGVYKKNQKN